MPTTDITIRAGLSIPIDMQLLTDTDGDGIAETGINLSGADHVELVLINNDTDGTTSYSSSDVSPKTSILPGSSGSVRFTPSGTTDLALTSSGASNIYRGYWWVYTTSSTKYSVPEEFELTIKVRP